MSALKLFQEKKVRAYCDAIREQWWFSVIEVLTDSNIQKRYWSDLKKKIVKEGSQLYEKIVQLKFVAADGKNHFFLLT